MPAPGYAIGHENREAVRLFFMTHLCATNRECAAALGLSECAVGRHVSALRAEWGGKAIPKPRLRTKNPLPSGVCDPSGRRPR